MFCQEESHCGTCGRGTKPTGLWPIESIMCIMHSRRGVEMEKDTLPFSYALLCRPQIVRLCHIYMLPVCDEVSFMFFLTRQMEWCRYLAIKTFSRTLTLRCVPVFRVQVAGGVFFPAADSVYVHFTFRRFHSLCAYFNSQIIA